MSKKTVLLLLSVLLMMTGITGCGQGDQTGVANADSVQQQIVNDVETEEDSENPAGPYEVERVVDGDTVVLNIDGVSEKVRLIGVDTPESVHPDGTKNTEYGKIASEYTKNALEGQSVGLELDVQERDKYNRLLAYIYLEDEMFNLKLLQEGNAKLMTYPPNVKYVEEFKEAQEMAKTEGKGLWSGEEAVYIAEGYIGNSNTKKFHEISCPSVSSMKSENIAEFGSRDEAVGEGYVPCGRCNP